MLPAKVRGKKDFPSSEAQRKATTKRDADFFAERRARDAANLEKTLRLKAQRLAHEATLPKAPPPKRRAKKAVAIEP